MFWDLAKAPPFEDRIPPPVRSPFRDPERKRGSYVRPPLQAKPFSSPIGEIAPDPYSPATSSWMVCATPSRYSDVGTHWHAMGSATSKPAPSNSAAMFLMPTGDQP